MNIRTFSLSIIAAFIGLSVCSCNDKHGDQLRSLGSRVEKLEENMKTVQANIDAISVIIKSIETNGYITKYVENSDGSHTLTFSDGSVFTIKDGTDGKDGKDGKEGTFQVGAKKGEDGEWYWTINDQWMLDEDGNKVRASATDGKDGKDGKDDINNSYLVPKTRINTTTNLWEISTDDGKTWVSTGIKGNGIDGKDGRTDVFKNLTLSADGTYVTIELANGTSFNVPVA